MRNFVSVDAGALRAALKLCSAVIERRNTYPILGMVRLTMRDEVLTIDATDLDILLSQKLPVRDGAGDWSTCVSVGGLSNIAWLALGGGVIIEPLAAEEVRVSLDQIDLFDSASYSLTALSPDSFPEIDGQRGALIEQFGNGRLAQLLGRVSWAMSIEETRYYLNGVAWQLGAFGRRMAATDGHRLATCTYDRAGVDGAAFYTRVLPTKLVRLIDKLSPATELAVHDWVRKIASPAIEIVSGDTVVCAKLVDLSGTTFPDIDRVMPRPESFTAEFTTSVDRLAAAVGGALALAPKGRDASKLVKLDRDATGKISVSSVQPDYGTSNIVLADQWPEGGASFGVNAKYLRQVLRHCAGTLHIHQVAARAPLTILDEDETMHRVLMPMAV